MQGAGRSAVFTPVGIQFLRLDCSGYEIDFAKAVGLVNGESQRTFLQADTLIRGWEVTEERVRATVCTIPVDEPRWRDD